MATKVYQTPDEWYQCLKAGAAAVRHPYSLRQFRHPGIPRITLYHLPSFTDATGWTIYANPRSEGFGLQTVTWHQRKDVDRMQALMSGEAASESSDPTLSETFAVIDPEWVGERISELTKIAVPLHAKRPIGLDGESFGISMRNEFHVEWWCEGPAEWLELITWAHGCISHFDSIKAEQGIIPNT